MIHKLLIVGVIAALAALVVGTAVAFAGSPGGEPHGPTGHGIIGVASEVLGMSPEDLIAELKQGKSIAQVAGERGVDLNTIVEAILAEQKVRIEELLNQPLPQNFRGEVHGFGHPGFGQHGGHGMPVPAILRTTADLLGLSPRELVAELREGKSIAQAAEERGVAPESIVEAVLSRKQEILDTAVANGRITQEEADERLARFEEKVQEALNRLWPQAPAHPLKGHWGSGLPGQTSGINPTGTAPAPIY